MSSPEDAPSEVSMLIFAFDCFLKVGVQIYPLAERVQIEFPETLIAVAAVVRQYMEDPVKARSVRRQESRSLNISELDLTQSS